MSLQYSTPVTLALYVDGKWQPLSAVSVNNQPSDTLMAGGSGPTSMVLVPQGLSVSDVQVNDQFSLGFYGGQLVGPQGSQGTLGTADVDAATSETTVFTLVGSKVPEIAESMDKITESATLAIGKQALGTVPGPSQGYYYLTTVPASQAVKVAFVKDPYSYPSSGPSSSNRKTKTPSNRKTKAPSGQTQRIVWAALLGLAAGAGVWVRLEGKSYQIQASLAAGGVSAGVVWFAMG